jgi:hypothetical protein
MRSAGAVCVMRLQLLAMGVRRQQMLNHIMDGAPPALCCCIYSLYARELLPCPFHHALAPWPCGDIMHLPLGLAVMPPAQAPTKAPSDAPRSLSLRLSTPRSLRR